MNSSNRSISDAGAGDREKPVDEDVRTSARQEIDALFDMLRLPPELASVVSSDERLPDRVGRYAIVKRLGQGGFGTVYLAYDDRLERPVAIKVSTQRRASLLADARKAASLRHDGIVTVHAVEEEPDESFFVVMEYLEGGSLADQTEASRRMPIEDHSAPHLPVERMSWMRPARIMADVAEALHYAHQQGIVHRDLKPENILLDRRGRPHVADFGLAVYQSQQADLEGEICGTAQYMAPEQIRGELDRIDGRTDVWGLGVCLYEGLTGQRPFTGEARNELFSSILDDMPIPPRQIVPSIPHKLQKVVLKCLAKDKAQRYGSAAEVAKDLRRSLAEVSTHATHQIEEHPKWRWPVGTVSALGVIVGLLFAVLIGGLAWRGNRPDEAQLSTTRSGQEMVQDGQRVKKFTYARAIQDAYRAWKSADVASALQLLEQLVPQSGEKDPRKFEWYYLRRLCGEGENTLRGHQGRVYGTAFSVAGQRLASCGEDGTICLWENTTGRLVHKIQADAGPLYAVAFSPDGRRLAAGGQDGQVRLWDTTSRQLQSTQASHIGGVTCLAFSPDGKTLATGSEDTTVRLADVVTGRLLARLRGHRATVHCIDFSPDGTRLFSASEDKSVKAWELESPQEPVADWGADWGRIFSLAVSPSGQVLAVSSETILLFIDLVDDTVITLPLEHRNTVRTICFSPDGRLLASAGDDQIVCVWDTNSRTIRHIFRGHTERIYHLAFSPKSDRLVTASRDGTVRIWNPEQPQDRHSLSLDLGMKVHGIAFAPDGTTLAALPQTRQWSRAVVWDVAKYEKVASCACPSASCFSGLAYCSGGTRMVLSTGDGLIMNWDFQVSDSAVPIRSFDVNAGSKPRIAVAPEGRLLAVAGNRIGSASIHEVETGRLLASLPGQTCVVFSPSGRLLATESANVQFAVELWDVESGRSMALFDGQSGPVYGLDFSKDGRYLAVAHGDGTARIWDVASGRLYRTFRAHNETVRDVAFHPSEPRVATAGHDGLAILWDTDTGLPLLQLPAAPSGIVEAVVFSPDGTILATGSSSDGKGHLDLWKSPRHRGRQ